MSRRPSAVRMAASELSEPYIGTTTATMRARSLSDRAYTHPPRSQHGQPQQLFNL